MLLIQPYEERSSIRVKNVLLLADYTFQLHCGERLILNFTSYPMK